jgi:hypothetical protein
MFLLKSVTKLEDLTVILYKQNFSRIFGQCSEIGTLCLPTTGLVPSEMIFISKITTACNTVFMLIIILQQIFCSAEYILNISECTQMYEYKIQTVCTQTGKYGV